MSPRAHARACASWGGGAKADKERQHYLSIFFSPFVLPSRHYLFCSLIRFFLYPGPLPTPFPFSLSPTPEFSPLFNGQGTCRRESHVLSIPIKASVFSFSMNKLKSLKKNQDNNNNKNHCTHFFRSLLTLSLLPE